MTTWNEMLEKKAKRGATARKAAASRRERLEAQRTAEAAEASQIDFERKVTKARKDSGWGSTTNDFPHGFVAFQHQYPGNPNPENTGGAWWHFVTWPQGDVKGPCGTRTKASTAAYGMVSSNHPGGKRKHTPKRASGLLSAMRARQARRLHRLRAWL
jgi:hypothetical protein